MLLKNDELRYHIARLEGRPVNKSKIEADLAIVRNDKLATEMSDSDEHALSPVQAEARIQEHHRKHPDDKMADIGDINREVDEFRAKVTASSGIRTRSCERQGVSSMHPCPSPYLYRPSDLRPPK